MQWQYPDAVEPVFVPPVAATPRGWDPCLPDLARHAVLPTALLVAASFFVPVVVVQAAPFVPPLLADPARPASRVQSESVEPIRLGLVHALDWYTPLSEPVRERRRPLSDTADPVRLGLVRSLDWYQPLSEPVRARPQPLSEITDPIRLGLVRSLDWYQPLAVPARRDWTPPDLAPFVFAPPAGPTLAWLTPLSEPGRHRRQVPLDLTAEPVLPWSPPAAFALWRPLLPDGPLRAARATPHLLPAMAFVDTTIPVHEARGLPDDKFTIGYGGSVTVTQRPTIGGPWSW